MWARAIFGDAIMANMMMLGYTCQLGYLPVGVGSLRRAIELNGQTVADNQLAFDIGRAAAVDPDAVPRLGGGRPGTAGGAAPGEAAGDRSRRRWPRSSRCARAFLVGYQNEAYAARFRDRVATVATRESRAMGEGFDELAKAVARNYFKLLAYKDEYEVARLYTDGSFRRQLDQELTGRYRIELNLAPQLFNARDPRTKRAKKRTFGRWIFPVLGLMAHGKRFRGTKLDLFGRSAHRRLERSLITTYEGVIDELLAHLTPANHELAVEIAEFPELIRGYDTVKEESVEATLARLDELLAEFRGAAQDAAKD